MLDIDEPTLILRTQEGETEAFGPLVEKYHRCLYPHIHGRVQNTEVAKDLTQGTSMKAFRSIASFRGDSAFYA